MAETKAKIALIGAGRWSRGWHIPQLVNNPKSELAALACGRMVPELAKEHNVPGFKTIEEFLADPVAKTIDGVIIATPHAVHFEDGMKCLEAGLNIFMEKPMTTDLPEAYKLTKAANEKGKIFMVNNTANWRKQAHQAQQMVERGDIGEIRHALVMFATPLGFIFNDPTQEGWVKPTGSMIGNGFAWGQLAHTFGWLWMVSGLKPKEVFAFMGKAQKTEADVYDSASILCENGATVSVSAIGIIPGKNKLTQNRLFGLDGMLSYSGSYEIDEGAAHDEGKTGPPKTEGELRLERFDGKDVVVPGFEFENIEQEGEGPESLRAFIDAVNGLPHFKGTTAEIGFLCVATIDAMYRSGKSGKAEPLLPLGFGGSLSDLIVPSTHVRKARIALVGAGRWSRGWHIPQLQNNPKSELVALACGRMVPDLSKEFGIPGFSTIEELLADPVKDTLDGIIIASPHAVHFELGMKCIEAGLNIFMEKPMTTDLPEALKMTKAANKKGKVFMVNNTANWRKQAHLAQQMVDRGDIGEIKHAMVMFATPLGFIFNDPTQEGWVKPSGNMLGNGFAWGQLAHTFGWLWMVSGLQPQEVFAYHGKGTKTDADVYDTASIRCTNGATVSVSACGIIPGKNKLCQNRLFGLEGMLSYSGSYEIDEGDAHEDGKAGGPKTEGELKLERFDGKDVTAPGFEFENIEQGGMGPESLKAFIDACLGEPHFKGTTADIGFLCVATIDAMYRSAQSGKAEPLLPEDQFEAWVSS